DGALPGVAHHLRGGDRDGPPRRRARGGGARAEHARAGPCPPRRDRGRRNPPARGQADRGGSRRPRRRRARISQPLRAALGLARAHGTDDAYFIGPLLSLGTRAAADEADRARSRRDPDASETARAAGTSLLAEARTIALGNPRPPAATLAHMALCEAEAARL